MKKHKLIIIVLLQSIVLTAQLDPNLLTFPVSPEVARLGGYGNLPVNLYYGQVDNSIGLFDFKVSNFDFQLNLNYNYAGNRVEEKPSLAGLGWSLNSGGSVTREVRGLPDEHPHGYYGDDYLRNNILNNYFNSGFIEYGYAKKILEGDWDSQVDKYILNVNNINFSFKIKLDGTPYFLSKHNYKLEIIRNFPNTLDINSFVLTDNENNKYYFEDVEINEPGVGNSQVFNDSFTGYKSSWQLTRIILSNNTSIYYNYTNDNFYDISFFASGSYRGYDGTSAQLDHNRPSYSSSYSKYLIRRKILNNITGRNFKIDFQISTIRNCKVYTKIHVKDNNNNSNIEYDFDYDTSRNVLKSILKNNHDYYSFSYYNEGSLPEFINSELDPHFNQDYWGFKNDAENNYGVEIPFSPYTCDKIPNFQTTLTGALHKINYPTGGFSEFFYEQNTIKKPIDEAESLDDINLDTTITCKLKSDNSPGSPETKTNIFVKTFPTAVVASLDHSLISYNNGHIIAKITRVMSLSDNNSLDYSDCTNRVNYYDYPSIVNTTACPKFADELSDHNGGTNPNTIYRSSGGRFIIPAGTYRIEISTDMNRYRNVTGSVTLSFSSGITHTNEKVGGIRVSKIIDNPVDAQQTTRYYDYNDDEGFSTAKEFSSLENTSSYAENFCFDIQQGVSCVNVYRKDYSSKTYNALTRRGIPVYYTKIIESIDRIPLVVNPHLICNCTYNFSNYDNTPVYNTNARIANYRYPKGYKIYTYEGNSGELSQLYPNRPANEIINPGQIKKTEVFSYLTTNDYNLKYAEERKYVNKNNLTDDNSLTDDYINSSFATDLNQNHPKSLIVEPKKIHTGGATVIDESEVTVANDFKLYVYKEFETEKIISQIDKSEYFNSGEIKSTTNYNYGNPIHSQLTSQITTSSSGETLETKYFYPEDSDMVNTPFRTELLNQNRLVTPIKTEKFKNGAKLSEEQTIYAKDATTGNLLLPKSVYSAKFPNNFPNIPNIGPLEKKITYEEYDNFGNPVAYSIGDNPANHTVVIWGYNHTYPVAKIENTTVDDAKTAFGVTNLSFLNETSINFMLGVINAPFSPLQRVIITTYTHIPLVGVSSITKSNGDVTTFDYDAFNRLKSVKDKDGNILSENEYYFKP